MKTYPDYEKATNSDSELGYRCSVCHEPFTIRAWVQRHADEDDGDCHAECCPICRDDPDEIPTGDVMA